MPSFGHHKYCTHLVHIHTHIYIQAYTYKHTHTLKIKNIYISQSDFELTLYSENLCTCNPPAPACQVAGASHTFATMASSAIITAVAGDVAQLVEFLLKKVPLSALNKMRRGGTLMS